MRPPSLRIKLTLWLTCILATIIALSDFVTYRALSSLLTAELDSTLLSMASLETSSFRDGVNGDPEKLGQRLQNYPRFFPQFVQVILSTGQVARSFGLPEGQGSILRKPSLAKALTGAPLTVDGTLDGHSIRIAVMAEKLKGQPFVAVAAAKTGNLTETKRWILLTLGLVDLLTLAACVAGGYVIIGKALRPVDHIAERARAIGAGDLHQRLKQDESSLEMSRLISVLNDMFDRLQRMFDSQRQFIQDASHEIRSPLAAIRCRLEVGLRQHRSADEYRGLIESSLQDVNRITDLSEDLLFLARAESENLSLELREVSLSDVLLGVKEQLAGVAEARHIEVTVDLNETCLIYGDTRWIHRVFRNLLENAIKYTPMGGSVQVSMALEGEFVRTEIRDTGVGIPPEDLGSIFRRFYRVDHARAREDGGTGLGLAICDQIVRAHRGRIEVSSLSGQGSSFTVFLTSAEAMLDQLGA